MQVDLCDAHEARRVYRREGDGEGLRRRPVHMRDDKARSKNAVAVRLREGGAASDTWGGQQNGELQFDRAAQNVLGHAQG